MSTFGNKNDGTKTEKSDDDGQVKIIATEASMPIVYTSEKDGAEVPRLMLAADSLPGALGEGCENEGDMI